MYSGRVMEGVGGGWIQVQLGEKGQGGGVS